MLQTIQLPNTDIPCDPFLSVQLASDDWPVMTSTVWGHLTRDFLSPLCYDPSHSLFTMRWINKKFNQPHQFSDSCPTNFYQSINVGQFFHLVLQIYDSLEKLGWGLEVSQQFSILVTASSSRARISIHSLIRFTRIFLPAGQNWNPPIPQIKLQARD